MRYSKSFAKSTKNKVEYDSKNASYLLKAGYIHQTMAGVYTFLPMGLKVLNKIENIVREEMNKIGEEIVMPALAPKKLWEDTGRYDKVDVLFKASSANESSSEMNAVEYVLNPTHEEVITPIAKEFAGSYKDLPFAAYQIQSKFRNEARPKSGLLRVREFRMKDLYSFHASEQDLLRFYNNEATKAYDAVFSRLGLGDESVHAYASGGDFTKEYSKEWQTKLETGEDLIFEVSSTGVAYNQEVAPSQAPEVELDSSKAKMSVVETVGVVGMEDLPKFLGVPAEKCMKTLIYETPEGEVIVAGVRGIYDINEEKLMKVAGVSEIALASEETVRRVTGAEIGYAGVVGLPSEVRLFVDESMEKAVNFECGGNKTDHHNINVNWDVDVDRPEQFYDLKTAMVGDIFPETGEVYKTYTASEVGNIFPLNTKFSDSIGYTFTDADGTEKPVFMGSYGIGTSRLVGVIAEKFSDEKGLNWPIAVAPYHVYLIHLGKNVITKEKTFKIYEELQKVGVQVLWDDQEGVSAGEKFNNADLLGMPIRVLISDRSLEQDSAEVKYRSGGEAVLVDMNELVDYLSQKVSDMMHE